MQSLGELVDRLTITNLKLWNVQEKFHESARGEGHVTQEDVRQQVLLNKERNRLMTEIDQCLEDGLRTGTARVDARYKT